MLRNEKEQEIPLKLQNIDNLKIRKVCNRKYSMYSCSKYLGRSYIKGVTDDWKDMAVRLTAAVFREP